MNMEQTIPARKSTRLYRLLALCFLSWAILGAVAVLGTWKVKTVASDVEVKLKERFAQEKLVVLQKVALYECRTCLLEATLVKGDAALLKRLRREYEEKRDSFLEYRDVLASGDATLGIVPPPRGSELEQKLTRLQQSWGVFQGVAESLFPAQKDDAAPTGSEPPPAADRTRMAQKELDAATAKVDGNIDEVLVTVGDLASETKAEVGIIQRHATLALLSAVVLAALLMWLGLWRSIEVQRARDQVVTHNAELQQQSRKLGFLYEISRTAGQTIILSELLDAVLGGLTKVGLFPFQLQGAIYLMEGNTLSLAAGTGGQEAAGESVAFGKSRSLAAAMEGEVVVSRACRSETCGTPLKEAPHGHVLVPLKAAHGTVGVLDLVIPTGARCDDDLLQMLSSVGSQLGVAISNARLFEQAKSDSLHDTLTGLPNRRFMDTYLEKSTALAERYLAPLSLVMLDIDHFKRFNDTHGHAEGDRLLAEVARIAALTFRSTDQLFRYGGEEFLAILPETDQHTACSAAERVRHAVEEQGGVTISLGIAAYRQGEAGESLIRRADKALYLAKRNGRNRVEVWQEWPVEEHMSAIEATGEPKGEPCPSCHTSPACSGDVQP